MDFVYDSVRDPWDQVNEARKNRRNKKAAAQKFRDFDFEEEKQGFQSTRIQRYNVTHQYGKGYYDNPKDWHKNNGKLDFEGFQKGEKEHTYSSPQKKNNGLYILRSEGRTYNSKLAKDCLEDVVDKRPRQRSIRRTEGRTFHRSIVNNLVNQRNMDCSMKTSPYLSNINGFPRGKSYRATQHNTFDSIMTNRLLKQQDYDGWHGTQGKMQDRKELKTVNEFQRIRQLSAADQIQMITQMRNAQKPKHFYETRAHITG